jgi:hypothetical protein
MKLKDFIPKIKMENIECNSTRLSITVDGTYYKIDYSNVVNTQQGMVNDFSVNVYQLIQK